MALSELREESASGRRRDGTHVERLGAADVAGGLALSDAAGWNQTADDWLLFMACGRVIGCRDDAGRLVATAAVLPYGTAAGWISMVLVDTSWRHRGLASALMRACVADLQASGATPFLDATPAGAAVYRRLGFAAGFAFERWQSNDTVQVDGPVESSQALDAPSLDRIALLDRAVTGLDRRFLLEHFLSRAGTRPLLAADQRGFAIARAGRRATQIGPLVAVDSAQAIELLGRTLASATGPVFIDVPTLRSETTAWLEQHGFQRQRSFVRMALGAAQVPGVDARCIALSGPEFG